MKNQENDPIGELSHMKKKEEKTITNPNPPTTGQCAKDSDCGIGEVCINGKCVPDITPPTPNVNLK